MYITDINSKKITLVLLTRKTSGGIKAHILDLVKSLDSKIYNITVIGPLDNDFINRLKQLNCKYSIVNIVDRFNPLLDLTSVLRIAKKLKEIKPNILHIHGNKAALVGRWAARLANVGNVIVTIHNFMFYQKKKGLISKIAIFEEKRLSRNTKLIIAVSNRIKEKLIIEEGIEENKIKVINNGIDIDQFKQTDDCIREHLSINKNDFIALNIARLVEFKGQKYLLESASFIKNQIPNFKLIILGSGPLESKLKKYSNKLGLRDTVIFLNNIDDRNKLYSSADCFVLPSTDEPFGLVLLEAMAHNLPIIATSSGGVLDILDQNTAILVEPKNSHQLAGALIKISKEKILTKELTSNAYRLLNQKFTLEKMVQQTQDSYKDIIDCKQCI